VWEAVAGLVYKSPGMGQPRYYDLIREIKNACSEAMSS
jgi:hypothetical protein